MLTIPTLLIIGRADPYLKECNQLFERYQESTREVIYHEEGHNIPSIRTELYPNFKAWIERHQAMS